MSKFKKQIIIWMDGEHPVPSWNRQIIYAIVPGSVDMCRLPLDIPWSSIILGGNIIDLIVPGSLNL